MKPFAGWFVNWNTSYCVLQLQSYIALGEGAAAAEPVSSFCCAAKMQVSPPCWHVNLSPSSSPSSFSFSTSSSSPPPPPSPSHHHHPLLLLLLIIVILSSSSFSSSSCHSWLALIIQSFASSSSLYFLSPSKLSPLLPRQSPSHVMLLIRSEEKRKRALRKVVITRYGQFCLVATLCPPPSREGGC